jgi:hypothetical protein
MKILNLTFVMAVLAVALYATQAPAALISMTADNSIGTSSFNSATGWSNAAAPLAGNDYRNADFLLRTPGVNGDFTFGGDSLLITGNPPYAAAANNDALLFKGTGAGNDIIVNNLTIDGGQLRQASGNGDFFYLGGNGLTVGPLGMAVHTQGPMFINSPVLGSGPIKIFDPGSGDAVRTVHFVNSANTYTGSIELLVANRSRFSLDSTGNLNFLIGAPGVNNSIFGNGNAIFDGTFQFDLSGAGTNFGDSWAIVTGPNKSYGTTFTVAGFSDMGGGLWSGAGYEFSTATGILTYVIPEPSSVLLVLGFTLLGACVRRRAS